MYKATIIIILTVILYSSVFVKAQESKFDSVKKIKPMLSTRNDVESIFGKPNDLSPFPEDNKFNSDYIYENESISVTYSNGKCTDGWIVPKNTVISIWLTFKEDRELSELEKLLRRQKTKLSKLRAEENYHGVKESFYDDKNGIRYTAHIDSKTWHSIMYYPSTKYSALVCED